MNPSAENPEQSLRERYEAEKRNVERGHRLSEEEIPEATSLLDDLAAQSRKLEERIEETLGRAHDTFEREFLRRAKPSPNPLGEVPSQQLKPLDRRLSELRHDTLDLHLGNLRRIARGLALGSADEKVKGHFRKAVDALNDHRREVREFFDVPLGEGQSLRRCLPQLHQDTEEAFDQLSRSAGRLVGGMEPQELAAAVEQLEGAVEALLEALKRVRESLDNAKADVREVVAQVVEWSRPACREREIDLQTHVRADEPLRVFVDRVSLRRLITEGIHNAEKHAFPADFSGPRQIDLTLTRTAIGIVIEISDTGGGLPEPILQRLGTVPQPAGDRDGGQGCYLLKQIVDSFGGSIEWRSSPGLGTDLLITIGF